MFGSFRSLKKRTRKVRSMLTMKGGRVYDQLSLSSHGTSSSHGMLADMDETDSADDSSNNISQKSDFTIDDDADSDSDTDNDVEMAEIRSCRPGPALSSNQESDKVVTVLKNVSLRFPANSLVAVCGSTGSGKSTLISGLMGECKLLSGSVSMKGENENVFLSLFIDVLPLTYAILLTSSPKVRFFSSSY